MMRHLHVLQIVMVSGSSSSSDSSQRRLMTAE
jgi:hypothetical protein